MSGFAQVQLGARRRAGGRLARCALLALVATAAGRASADLDLLDLETLGNLTVSAASRYAQPLRDAPSAVQVIDREAIRRHGWRTLGEALQSLAGVYATSDRTYTYLGTRAFLIGGDYSTRFLLLVDGARINDNIYEQALFSEEFPLDLALVERIEYAPGPGSALYGSNALFGVVNVITSKNHELPPVSVAATATSNGWREGRATLVTSTDAGPSLLLSVSGGRKSGRDQQYDDPTGNLVVAGGGPSPDGVARGLDSQEQEQFFARIEGDGFSLTGIYSRRQVEPSTALYGTLFNDPGLFLEDGYASLSARYSRAMRDDLALETRVEYAEMRYDAEYPFDDGAGNRYVNRDHVVGRWWATDLRARYWGLDDHTLLAGIDWQGDAKARQQAADIGVTINPPVDTGRLRHRIGFYLQDAWSFAPGWQATLGLRHDRFSETGTVNSPRGALIWQPNSDSVLKLMAGRAYRLPNAYERDYGDGTTYLPSPDLQPERIRTLEAVWEQNLGGGQDFALSLFDYQLDRLISQQDVAGTLQYQNTEAVSANGVEARWSRRWNDGARLAASASVHDHDRQADPAGDMSPTWTAKLNGSHPLPGGSLLLAVEVSAIGEMDYLWQGSPQHLGSLAVVDLVLTRARVVPGLDGHLRVRNLFDRDYGQPASSEVPVPVVPGDERRLEASIGYTF
ncbi:MAG TPA: TonB-dependent receptor [Rhodocyclaceae bacterium]